MSSPNSTFTELVSTTFRKHRKEIKDNLSHRNALLKYMMKRGNHRTEDGGLTIATPTTSTIDGVAGPVALTVGTGVGIRTDGTDYYTTGLGIANP